MRTSFARVELYPVDYADIKFYLSLISPLLKFTRTVAKSVAQDGRFYDDERAGGDSVARRTHSRMHSPRYSGCAHRTGYITTGRPSSTSSAAFRSLFGGRRV